MLVWKQEGIPCDLLPECFIDFLKREGVVKDE